MVLTKQQIINWLILIAKLMKENEKYLTELDSAIGDADHGRNMTRGFGEVKRKLPTVSDKDIGTILKTSAMSLMLKSGGACGQLYANFFVRSAAAVVAKEQLEIDELLVMLNAGLEGVYLRGRAIPGEKTMVDTLTPATVTLRDAIESNLEYLEALQLCVTAAEKGMKDTIPMQAKKGRASYLGERSIGHQDPGATSSYFIFKALYLAATGETG